MSQSDHGYAQQFMTSLRDAEKSNDLGSLSRLFSSDATLENLTRPFSHHGANSTPHSTGSQTTDVTAFWRQYLTAFSSIESHFTHVVECGSTIVLEWHSVGSLSNGIPIAYNGVSILEVDGNQIQKFRTYYDSAALLPHSPKSGKNYSHSVGVPTISTQASS